MNGNGAIKVPYAIAGMALSAVLAVTAYWLTTNREEIQDARNTSASTAATAVQVGVIAEAAKDLRRIMSTHTELAGHPVMVQKMLAQEREYDVLRTKIDGMVDDMTEIKANQRAIIGKLEVMRDPRNYADPRYPGYFKKEGDKND